MANKDIENDKTLIVIKIICAILIVCLILELILDYANYGYKMENCIKITAASLVASFILYELVKKYKNYIANADDQRIQAAILADWPNRNNIKIAASG